MKHISIADSSAERVSVGSVSRNFLVVIDRDLVADSAVPLGAEKQRMLAEGATCGESGTVWITQH
jgi:hypothetical protein